MLSFIKFELYLFFCKTRSRCLVLSDRLSGESQTSCPRVLSVLMVVALYEVGTFNYTCRSAVGACGSTRGR